MLLELADGGRFEMVGFGDAEGFGRLPGGIAVAEPCMHATMGPKLAQALQLACVLARGDTRCRRFDRRADVTRTVCKLN